MIPSYPMPVNTLLQNKKFSFLNDLFHYSQGWAHLSLFPGVGTPFVIPRGGHTFRYSQGWARLSLFPVHLLLFLVSYLCVCTAIAVT